MSDFLRVKTYSYYGDIVAKSDAVSCLYISKQALDERIPVYDLEKIKKACMSKKNMTEAGMLYSQKFNQLLDLFVSQRDRENFTDD